MRSAATLPARKRSATTVRRSGGVVAGAFFLWPDLAVPVGLSGLALAARAADAGAPAAVPVSALPGSAWLRVLATEVAVALLRAFLPLAGAAGIGSSSRRWMRV